MARVEPETVDRSRWPGLVAPDPESGGARRGATRDLRDAMLKAASELGVRLEFPDGSSVGSLDSELAVVLREPEAFFARLALRATTGLAESYMAGEWISGDLPGVLGAVVPWLARHPDLEAVRRHHGGRGTHRRRAHDHDHHDVGTAAAESARSDFERGIAGDLVALFADATMATSSALFASGARSRSSDGRGRSVVHVSAPPAAPHRLDLGDAQRRAHELLLGLAGVEDGTRAVVVPPGWGELPMRAAERGAQVRAVTESVDRLNVVGARIRAAHLDHAVTLRLGEFGELTGETDAVVVSEPGIEGAEGFAAAVGTSARLLTDGGRLAVQTPIGSDRFAAELAELTNWRTAYIDARMAIPLRSDVKNAFERHPEMRIRGRVEFGEHAAHTARLWRENLSIRGRDAAAQGFDPVFRRMWHFHLAAAETSFARGWVDAWQILAVKGDGDRAPRGGSTEGGATGEAPTAR